MSKKPSYFLDHEEVMNLINIAEQNKKFIQETLEPLKPRSMQGVADILTRRHGREVSRQSVVNIKKKYEKINNTPVHNSGKTKNDKKR